MTLKRWECPECGHEKKTAASRNVQPFCPECDDRHASHIEMQEADA